MNIEFFQTMTPEELDLWIREVVPFHMEWQERSQVLARRRAFELIRRPVRKDRDQRTED